MKYKYMLFGSFITMIIIFLFSILIIPFYEKEIITIGEVNNFKDKISALKDDLKEVEEETCLKSLKDMLKRIKQTNFKKEVTIKEYYKAYYKDEKSFYDLYTSVLKECSLEEKDDITRDVINESIFPEMIRNKYILRYELTLRDFKSRQSLDKNLSEKATFTTKSLELNIIKRLIEEVLYEENL